MEVAPPEDLAHPSKKRLNGYGPAGAIIVVLVTYFLSQIFAGVLIGIGASLFGYDSEEVLRNLETSTLLQFLYVTIVELLTLAGLYYFMNLRKVKLSDIGLGRRFKLSDVGSAIPVFGVYFIALIAATAAIESLLPNVNIDQKQQLGFEAAVGGGQLALVFVSLVILPAVVEEIMVRGFLYSGLRSKLSKKVAAVVASVIFGAAHLQLGSGADPLWIAAVDTTILSLFLIYLREKTGALWAGMVVHGIKNSLAFLALFVFKV